MRLYERDYEEFPTDRFPNMVQQRAFSDCRVWTAGVEQPLIVLAEDTTRRLAVFEYDSLEERQTDLVRICRLPEDGGEAGSGVTACRGPVPPPRGAGAAERQGLEEKR
ncbi:MAG: hypothetical protein ACO1SX_03025 [Actinomycetota bacterium]